MKNYELMYIVDPSSEEEMENVKQKIEGIITGREGVITSFEKIGKKRFAYPISKKQFGTYFLVTFTGIGTIVKAIETFLQMNSVALRYIVLAFTNKELKLRNETDRIQREEDERMRLGGRPSGYTEDKEIPEIKIKSPFTEASVSKDKAVAPDTESKSTDPEKEVEPSSGGVESEVVKTSVTIDAGNESNDSLKPDTTAADDKIDENATAEKDEKSNDKKVE